MANAIIIALFIGILLGVDMWVLRTVRIGMNTQPQLLPKETRSISFTVWGAPVAQPREKSTVFKDKGGNFRSRTHPVDTIKNPQTGEKKPHPIVQWKADVKQAFSTEYPEHVPFRDVPLHFQLLCILPRPQSLMGHKHPDGLIPCFKSKDWDNLGKSAADVLNGLAYTDDRLIAWGEVRKFYHEKEGRPRAEIRIEEL